MDRRNLVFRRFGAVDFGLGVFEEGVWIDHTSLRDGGASLGIHDGMLAELHDLLACCAGDAQPIAVEGGTLTATLIDRSQHVQPVAGRSSAG